MAIIRRYYYLAVLLLLSACMSGQIAIPGVIASSIDEGEEPEELLEIHPVTHDQTYLVPDDVWNNDSIGTVHYLCTDSIFNDRDGDTYSFSIVSGNTGTAFAINSSSGMLSVNDSTAIDDDFALGVEVAVGDVKDTATCDIIYRTSPIYIDFGAGGGGDGSRATPYNDVSTIDSRGDLTGGETVLFARGSDGYAEGIYINNGSGDRIFIGAWGTGAKPILRSAYDGVDNLKIFWLGEDNAETPPDSETADSVTIMDLKIYGKTDDKIRAIQVDWGSEENKFYRNHTVYSGGNGAVYIRGQTGDPLYNLVQDHFGESPTARAIKTESSGTVMENVWSSDIRSGSGFIMMGQTLQGTEVHTTVKYAYAEFNGSSVGKGIDMRDSYCDLEWAYIKNAPFAVSVEDADYFGGSDEWPTIHDCTIKNVIIDGTSESSGIQTKVNSTNPYDDPPYNIYIENVLMVDVIGRGININDDADSIYIKNCVIIDSGNDGIEIEAGTTVAEVTNTIVYGSGTFDIEIAASSSDQLINCIYDTKNGTSSVELTNYAYSSGDPFEDKANGDYSTAAGIIAVIDAGSSTNRPTDIINNPIGTQDIGAFEFGGLWYNWTIR